MHQINTSKTNNKQAGHSNVRIAVINTLLAIQNGKSLSQLLDPLLNSLQGDDKGFAHALLLTSLRHWHATARLLDSLADNPIDEIEVRTTIQVGITQLLYLNVADHAAINETVEAVKHIDFARASGIVNAILRKVAKNPNKFRKKANKNHSLPNWLARQLKQDWRDEYEELTQGLRETAPMFLRVNSLQMPVDDYANMLQEEDISSELFTLNTRLNLASNVTLNNEQQIEHVEQKVLRLVDSVPVSQLPEFDEGVVSVQDAHAQLAAPIINHALTQLKLLDNRGEAESTIRILDACAAPGGKLAHWLELLGKSEGEKIGLFHVKQSDENNAIDKVIVMAIDDEPSRNTRIFENLERLQLPASIVNSKLYLDIICADATQWQLTNTLKQESSQPPNSSKQPKQLNKYNGFDAILLDAPCTATGVIRRHPDITILREEEDVQHTAQLQEQILDNLWPQLNVGGYFLYVTCSILKTENVEQMQAFLNRHTDAQAIPFDNKQTNWGIEQAVGRQCLPIDAEGGDGFYYALLQKQDNPKK